MWFDWFEWASSRALIQSPRWFFFCIHQKIINDICGNYPFVPLDHLASHLSVANIVWQFDAFELSDHHWLNVTISDANFTITIFRNRFWRSFVPLNWDMCLELSDTLEWAANYLWRNKSKLIDVSSNKTASIVFSAVFSLVSLQILLMKFSDKK